MKINEELRAFWKNYWDRGDNNQLSALTGLAPSMISKILSGGCETVKTSSVKKINDFYKQREKEVKLIISSITTVESDKIQPESIKTDALEVSNENN